jgi:RNA polymerase sigma factor (sigma-70 family)
MQRSHCGRMHEQQEDDALNALLLSHLDSAYNLAHWLVRTVQDAEDVVQEAYLRAFRYSGTFRGGNERAWLLAIVRNTAFAWLRNRGVHEPAVEFDEAIHAPGDEEPNPEELMVQNADAHLVADALASLPVRYREILALRELEGLSYKEIGQVLGIPQGTVMSTLSRARDRFRQAAGNLLSSQRLRNGSSHDRSQGAVHPRRREWASFGPGIRRTATTE